MIKIIDHKKVEMTQDEYQMYTDICQSYDKPPTQKGQDLFIDLFETNDDGLILFVKPPGNRATSMEVFMFMISLQTNQHLRAMYKQVNEGLEIIKDLTNKVESKLKELDKNENFTK
jgi:hypothetical protein